MYIIVDKNNLIQNYLSFYSLCGFKILSANPTKWSDTIKQFFVSLLTNCFWRVFDHFLGLALKGLKFPLRLIALSYSTLICMSNHHLLVQSQQLKHQHNVWNLFKLTIVTLERCHWGCSGVFVVNFEHVSHNVLMFPWLILNK